MVEYSLRISVPEDKASSYESWLLDHSQTITNLSGFTGCTILSGPGEDGTVVFHVRYQLRDEQSFQEYLRDSAQKMRQEGVDMFGSFVTIQRDLVRLKHQLAHQGE